jgi:hypothetical protein
MACEPAGHVSGPDGAIVQAAEICMIVPNLAAAGSVDAHTGLNAFECGIFLVQSTTPER